MHLFEVKHKYKSGKAKTCGHNPRQSTQLYWQLLTLWGPFYINILGMCCLTFIVYSISITNITCRHHIVTLLSDIIMVEAVGGGG